MSVEVDSNTDRARWVVLQKKEEKMWRKQFGEHVITRPDGLMMLAPPGDSAKILVPEAERKALVDCTHIELAHAGFVRTRKALDKSYAWKNMVSEIKRIVGLCHVCRLTKVRERTAHGQYSSVQYEGPRQAVGVDFYSMMESECGMKAVMTLCDLFTLLPGEKHNGGD